MPSTMQKAELKNFSKPDEVRSFPKGKVEIVKIGGATVGRATFEPGWKWSTSVQPLAKTKSCEAPYSKNQARGTFETTMKRAPTLPTGAGDVSPLPRGPPLAGAPRL